MCGIAGWILKEKPSSEFTFALMYAMQQRGHQSYGYYNGETDSLEKDTGAIVERLKANALRFSHGFIHTRHATTGAITKLNSHPFRVGNLVGAHNGVIDNHKEIQTKYARNCAVDSEHIFAHISESKPLSELEGYGAIEYTQGGHYFVGRCNGGELAIALLKEGIVWASTAEAIRAAIFQAGYTLIHFYEVDEGELYEARLSGLFTTKEKFDLSERALFNRKQWWEYSLPTATFDKPKKTSKKKTNKLKTEPTRPTLCDVPRCDFCGTIGPITQQSDGSVLCDECTELFADDCEEYDAIN